MPTASFDLSFLCGFAFLAGFIDSIAGGGGLIQLPAMLALLPQWPVVAVLGTNKFVASLGTLLATTRYLKQVKVNARMLVLPAVTAFVFSFLGAKLVSIVPNTSLKPAVFCLLIAVWVYTFRKKDFGGGEVATMSTPPQWIGFVAGAAIGLYDGFLGPGTGTFLMFVFLSIYHMGFLQASAATKIVNLATNVAALLFFLFKGHVVFATAIPMALFNVLGNYFGSQMAIKKGTKFVRILFLFVVAGTMIKFGIDIFQKK